MSPLVIDNGFPRVISAKTHSVIDYIHAGANFFAGIMLRKRDSRASKAAYVLGASVLANALMTDYPLGVFRLYSFRVHGILDYGVAAASALMPELLGLKDSVSREYFRGQGAGETLIAGLSDYTDDSGSRRRGRRYDLQDIRRLTSRRAA